MLMSRHERSGLEPKATTPCDLVSAQQRQVILASAICLCWPHIESMPLPVAIPKSRLGIKLGVKHMNAMPKPPI